MQNVGKKICWVYLISAVLKALEKFAEKYYKIFKAVIRVENKFSDYKTISDTAIEWNIHKRMVLRYCATGRIPGAMKVEGIWLIPRDATKPEDGRKNNRRQPKREAPLHE
jgi:hypothetical protein